MKKLLIISILIANYLFSQEFIIGEENIDPGIILIFEGAIKDKIYPLSMNLKENQTNIHIEARVNWGTENIPNGTPKGGFVPYLKINAEVTNQKSGMKSFIDLYPHINLSDNFHYARNIALPGEKNDLYMVTFTIHSPSKYELFFHDDWDKKYGNNLIVDESFSYENINFSKIVDAKRK